MSVLQQLQDTWHGKFPLSILKVVLTVTPSKCCYSTCPLPSVLPWQKLILMQLLQVISNRRSEEILPSFLPDTLTSVCSYSG